MDLLRIISLQRVTGSVLVSERPCLIYSIAGIGVADSSNVYDIYDGYTTGGDLLMKLVAASYDVDFRSFSVPLYFAHGIYVNFTTNGVEVFIQYKVVGK